MVEVDDHVASGLDQVGLFPAAEDSSRRHVIKVLGLEPTTFLRVFDAAECLGIGFRIVAHQILIDILGGCIAAGARVADGPAEEAHLGARRDFRRFGLRLRRLLGLRLLEEGLARFLDVEFFRQAGNELLQGEVLPALVVVGHSQGDGIAVQHLAIGIVIPGAVLGHLGALDGNAVQGYLDDAAIGPNRIGAFTAVLAIDVHDVVREFLADEVLDDIGTSEGLGEEVFLSHGAGPPDQ